MKVYIAGPMRGRPLYNFPAFHAAADALRGLGITVLSPAEADLADGFTPTQEMDTATPTTFSDNFTQADWHDAMRRDLYVVLDVDAVVVLPGWEDSRGACAEVFVAQTVGTDVIDFETLEIPS